MKNDILNSCAKIFFLLLHLEAVVREKEKCLKFKTKMLISDFIIFVRIKKVPLKNVFLSEDDSWNMNQFKNFFCKKI